MASPLRSDSPHSDIPRIMADLCEALSSGQSLRSYARSIGIDESTLRFWSRRAEYAPQYARAREEQAHTLVDEIIELSDKAVTAATSEEVQARRLQVDTRKWFAGKVLPKIYGERVDHNVSGTANIVHEIKLTSGLRNPALPPEREIQALPAAETDGSEGES